MSKKLEDKISLLENKVKQLENEHKDIFENLRFRDYLIKTDFTGKLWNSKLIFRFNTLDILGLNKLPDGDRYFDSSTAIRNQIMDYDFTNIKVFMDSLEKYEKEQDIINQDSDCKDNKKGETEK